MPYIPLQPGSKAAAIAGWARPGYSMPKEQALADGDGRVALRCDGLVVVDCDSPEAAAAWISQGGGRTLSVKTPRGVHYYYRAVPGGPSGPAVGVLPGVDIRAGRGSYVVAPPTDGYLVLDGDLAEWDRRWLPQLSERAPVARDGEEWDEIPDGRGNITMTAIAGALRRQGMSYEAMEEALTALNPVLMPTAPMPAGTLEQIARSVSRYEPDPDVEIVLVEDTGVTSERYMDARRLTLPPPPEWLWRPYFPTGRLVMLDGQEGIGKGMLCVYLAVRTTRGEPLAPGAPVFEPASVLWFSAEDDPEEDVLRRLAAAGYDPDEDEAVIFWNPRTARPRAPQDITELRAAIDEYRPRLVILDPGRSFIAPPDEMKGETGFNNEAAVRPAMEALNRLAHDTGVTIVFVHHWNKRSDGSTRDKSGGSVAFQQVVRHKLTVAQVGEARALSVEKSNIVDRHHHVWSYNVAAVEELDSAAFVLGEHLPEYPSLDEWIEVAKRFDAESHIEVITDWEDAALYYGRFLAEGDPAPTRGQISHDLGISEDAAKRVRSGLRDAGLILGAPNRTGKWGPMPPTIQGRLDAVREATGH